MTRRILFIAIVAILGIGAGFAADRKGNTFMGRVILVGDTYIEIKKGIAEFPFYWATGAQVYQDGASKAAADVKLCQTVRASWEMNQNRKTITRLEILKESDCQ